MDLAFWRDVALVVLAVESLIFGLIPLVLFFFGIRGVRWLNRRGREYGPKAREQWHHVHRRVERVTDVARQPFARVDELVTLARSLIGVGEQSS